MELLYWIYLRARTDVHDTVYFISTAFLTKDKLMGSKTALKKGRPSQTIMIGFFSAMKIIKP